MKEHSNLVLRLRNSCWYGNIVALKACLIVCRCMQNVRDRTLGPDSIILDSGGYPKLKRAAK